MIIEFTVFYIYFIYPRERNYTKSETGQKTCYSLRTISSDLRSRGMF